MEKAVLITAFAGRFAASAFLAFTTSLVVYPTFASFAAELMPGWGHFCGVFASVIIFMALDGTLSKLLPYNMHKLVNLDFKGGSQAVEFGIVTILTYALLAGTMLSSYWANPMISQWVFGDADKGLIEQAQNEDIKAAESIDLYSVEFQEAQSKLEKAEQKAAELIEAAIVTHPDRRVQKAMRTPLKSSGWYFSTPKLAEYRARIARAKTKGEKGINVAQKELSAAISKRNAYIEKKEVAAESTKAQLLSIYQNEQAAKDNLKVNSNNVLLLLDLSTGGLMTLLSLIIALMIKNNPGIRVPEAGSLTEILFKVLMSVKKLIIIGLEYLTRSDLNGDGFIGEKKTENQVGEPTLIKAQGTDIEAKKMFQTLAVKVEAQNEKLSQLERENLSLRNSKTLAKKTEPKKTAKKSQPKTQKVFSLKSLKDQITKISDEKGFAELTENAAKDELLKFEKNALRNGCISDAKKWLKNAQTAIKKSAKESTKAKNLVKANWLAKVVALKDQKLT